MLIPRNNVFNPIWSGLFDAPYGPGGGGGTYAPPPLISKSTNSILMTFYSTLYKNCSHYISAICFKIGLELAEIIRCLCTKVVFFQIIGDRAVPWTSSIEFVACMSSENCCAQKYHVMLSVCHSIVEILQSKDEQDAREAMRVVFFCTYKTYLYA